MATIRVGVQLQPQHTTYPEYADIARRVEEIGVDSIWTWDHFFPLSGDPNGTHFEGYTMLTAIAAITTKPELGCFVTCNSYRNPSLLTHIAKTIDHISNGRFILGIGAGWFERDYTEFGYEFGTAASRLHDLGEALPIIKQRMSEEVPLPIRNPMPILIGGGGEKVTLKLTAQYATMWNTFGPLEKWISKNAILTEWCEKIGRNPAEIERTVGISPKEVSGDLDGFVKAGATHFILAITSPWDLKVVEDMVNWCKAANA